ncbi:mismatch-specific DNA-glycosylase [Naumannella halotolerans]|uniref:TDG/mug DNA glycosylase family protein n=1 Tax=Naumannella halotolerans TaxID=993414 RepID=A0A4R7J4A7_9ACTN|nr:mismatch-specific DNA-glycosylase [Naumannella halotolerans]TDT31179.1 TDG/mug DNA glycosylase family protein [Naumannella halotolerans]
MSVAVRQVPRLAVPDLIGPGCRLLFAGINPGLWSARTGAHFARPGNRFWPALYAAGITDRLLDMSEGESAVDRDYLISRGIGITNVVRRPSARADELSTAEFRAGGERLRRFVTRHHPAVIAFAGIGAYRTAMGKPKARTGEQPESWGRTRVWVVPNPSGLNAHETVQSLAAAYAQAARAAGIPGVID